MARRIKGLLVLLILTLLSISVFSSDPTEEGDYGTVGTAIRSIACLLKIVEDVYLLVTLAMVLMGAFKYVSAGEDKKTRLLGRKFIILGMVGAMLVYMLIYVSCEMGFGTDSQGNKLIICPDNCTESSLGPPRRLRQEATQINPSHVETGEDDED